MQHFSEEDWIDFARGLSTDRLAKQMKAHLGDGCADCARELAIWQSMRELAVRKADYDPPAELVRSVRPLFAQQYRAAERRSFARLIFDSLLVPLPVGVRSGSRYSRHLLYEAVENSIDVHIIPGSEPSEFVLSGQILPSEHGCASVTCRSPHTTTTVRCSPEGEFCLKTCAALGMELDINLAEGQQITICLPANLTALN